MNFRNLNVKMSTIRLENKIDETILTARLDDIAHAEFIDECDRGIDRISYEDSVGGRGPILEGPHAGIWVSYKCGKCGNFHCDCSWNLEFHAWRDMDDKVYEIGLC